MIRRLLARLRSNKRRLQARASPRPETLQFEALARAHGDWLALLATILEREGVIAGDDLARLLAEFATATAADRPAEGRILAFWAAYLQDTAASLRDFPSIH